MTQSKEELNKNIAKEKYRIEHQSWMIHKCNQRIYKFENKMHSHKKHSPKWEQANKKVVYWRRRKHDAIYARTHFISLLTQWIKAKQSFGTPLVTWAKKYVGVHEGSALQIKWANDLGYSAALPWCSIFVANGIRAKFPKLSLPSNPAYSGSWASWKDGKRIAINKRRAGDLCVYDWGDGGLTDHVAICEGKNGKRVGGNQSDAVTEEPIDAEFIVFVIRPRGM